MKRSTSQLKGHSDTLGVRNNPSRLALCRLSLITTLIMVWMLALPYSAMSQTAGATGGAPRTISYQGMITDNEKAALDGVHRITVTLYADENGTTPIWTESYSQTIANGIFNVALGGAGTTPLPEPSKMDRPIWVGTRVDGGAELRPLSQLSSTPYAMNVADKSITSNKMATDYVGSISVNGEKISAKGSDVNFVAGNGIQMTVDPATNTVLLQPGDARDGKGAKSQWTGFNPGSNNDGLTNAPADISNSIGGGAGNTANPTAPNTPTPGYASILGGLGNTAGYAAGGGSGNQYASVGGGTGNTANGTGSTVGGGRNNTAGQGNVAGANHDQTVSGGDNNVADGTESAIAGGGWLKVGNNSFGFNNPSGTGAVLSDVSLIPNIGYFGNVDLHIGNTDNAARSLVLWGPNGVLAPGAVPTATSITAGTPAASVTYVLPTNAPTVGNDHLIGSTAGSPVQLSWAPGGSGGVTSVGTGLGLQGGPITTTGTVDLRLNAGGGLSKTLGGGSNELGIAANGIVNSMILNVDASKITTGILPEARGGTNHGNYTLGSVIFAGAANTLSENNAQFFWDNTNTRLGLGTATPNEKLEVKGNLRIDAAAAANFTTFKEPGGGGVTSMTYTLPNSVPTAANQYLGAVIGLGTATPTLGWLPAGTGGGGWNQSFGNAGTNPIPAITGTDWVGTNDATDLAIAANYVVGSGANDDIHINATTHDVGINQPNPDPNVKLDVNGTIWSESVLADPQTPPGPNGPAINQKGEIYRNNVVLAWGDIPGVIFPGGNPFINITAPPAPPAGLTGFNINMAAAPNGVTWYAPNICVITLNIGGFALAPGSAFNLGSGEACVTANIIEDPSFFKADPVAPGLAGPIGPAPGFCTVTMGGPEGVPIVGCVVGAAPPPLGPNQIAVRTYQMIYACPGPGGVTMQATPLPFTFNVLGR